MKVGRRILMEVGVETGTMKAEVIVQRPLTVLVAGSTPTPRWPIIWTRPWHLSDSTRPILPIRSVPFTDVSRSSVICCSTFLLLSIRGLRVD